MTPRRQRMIFVAVILIGVSAATALALTAVGENMLYFYSPTQLQAGEAPTNHAVRIGGLVVDGSAQRAGDSLKTTFGLTDGAKSVTVAYTGILPDLFREGQGVVTTGRMGEGGLFLADEVLAKHDENYLPPDLAERLGEGTAHSCAPFKSVTGT